MGTHVERHGDFIGVPKADRDRRTLQVDEVEESGRVSVITRYGGRHAENQTPRRQRGSWRPPGRESPEGRGMDTIFPLRGGQMIDIHDGCIDDGVRVVDVRHEQTATHAADDDARRFGKLDCAVTTARPGFSNAVTGIATAFCSVSPVLRSLDIPGYFNDAARDREHQDRSERIRAGDQVTDDVQVTTLTIVPVRTIPSMSPPGITRGGRP
jgi:hypothetical protein